MLDAQVLVCLSVGLKCWKFYGCWDAQVLVCQSVGLKCGSPVDVGCTGTCVPISWVEVLELPKMLAAQVLQCLSVGLMCWESFANTLYVSAIFPSEMLDAQVLVCLSVVMKCRKFCWDSCANTLYVSTIFPQTSWLHRYSSVYRLV